MAEENKKAGKSPRHGDIATIYFISTVGSGPMYVDEGDRLEIIEKLNGLRIQKKDGRAYYIPYTSIAFIRFEARKEEVSTKED